MLYLPQYFNTINFMIFNYWQGDSLSELPDNGIFVFGSNPQGWHGAGAALTAKNLFGAVTHKGRGQINRSYALVTKNLSANFTEEATGLFYEKEGFASLSLEQINLNISELLDCVIEQPEKDFYLAYKNDKWQNNNPKKGLNGYAPIEIVKLFAQHGTLPKNMILHESFSEYIEKTCKPFPTYYYFYGKEHPFSQHHKVSFTYKGITFDYTEQFMMYSKAMLFNDYDAANQILAAGSPAEMARIGRRVENFDEELWKEKRFGIVYVANREKFTQNPHLLNALLSTQGKLLAEASPSNRIWGIGVDINSLARFNPTYWNGMNLLGEILTLLRDNLLIESKELIEHKA